MKRFSRLLVAALVAIMLAGPVFAQDTVSVTCTSQGSVMSVEAHNGATLKTPGLMFSFGYVAYRDDSSSPTAAGGVTPSVLTGATYYQCAFPPSARSLGTGTANYQHMGGAVGSSGVNANSVAVEIVEIGTLDIGDNRVAGTHLGKTASWPRGPRGMAVSVPVDFGGRPVSGAVTLRLGSTRTGLNPSGQVIGDAWYAIPSGTITLTIDVLPDAPIAEADPLAGLAAATGLTVEQLRVILAFLQAQK